MRYSNPDSPEDIFRFLNGALRYDSINHCQVSSCFTREEFYQQESPTRLFQQTHSQQAQKAGLLKKIREFL